MKPKALLLAAGKGTRLWPLTEVRAKAAVPFRGTPLIRSLLSKIRAAGIKEVAVNLHHAPHTVERVLEGAGVVYSYEEELLGTSGALHPLRGFFGDAPFWTVNAKIWCSMLPPFSYPGPATGAIITATLVRAGAGTPYTRVDISGSPPLIRGFGPAHTHNGTGYVFTGIQLLSPEVWEYLPPAGFSHFVPDVYDRIWEGGEGVAAVVYDGAWKEFSTLSRYLNYHLEGDGTEPSQWGYDVHVHRGAHVARSVLWDRVKVEQGAHIDQCILADDVVIESGRSLQGMAVVPLAQVGEDPRGEVLDNNLLVPIEA